nr:hypothetical protein [uncultured Flavobacterium sp.]
MKKKIKIIFLSIVLVIYAALNVGCLIKINEIDKKYDFIRSSVKISGEDKIFFDDILFRQQKNETISYELAQELSIISLVLLFVSTNTFTKTKESEII